MTLAAIRVRSDDRHPGMRPGAYRGPLQIEMLFAIPDTTQAPFRDDSFAWEAESLLRKSTQKPAPTSLGVRCDTVERELFLTTKHLFVEDFMDSATSLRLYLACHKGCV